MGVFILSLQVTAALAALRNTALSRWWRNIPGRGLSACISEYLTFNTLS